jgi:hypothetical protein
MVIIQNTTWSNLYFQKKRIFKCSKQTVAQVGILYQMPVLQDEMQGAVKVKISTMQYIK